METVTLSISWPYIALASLILNIVLLVILVMDQ